MHNVKTNIVGGINFLNLLLWSANEEIKNGGATYIE